jgi:hypothetical protein
MSGLWRGKVREVRGKSDPLEDLGVDGRIIK